MYRPNGTLSYEGNFLRSLRQGLGKYQLSNGTYFAGQFDRDCMKEGELFNKKTGLRSKQWYNVDADLANKKDHTMQKPIRDEVIA